MLETAPPEIHEAASRTGGWLSAAEGDLLYSLAKSCKEAAIVEIGSFEGKSTTYVGAGSRAGGNRPIYAIDPHTKGPTPNSFPNFQAQISRVNLNDLVYPIVSLAQDAAKSFHEPIGLLFIDGAHDDASVKLDWDLWVPKVIPGGYVALHDTLLWSGPSKVAEVRLFRSNGFVGCGLADSISYGRKRLADEAICTKPERARLLLLKRTCNVAVRVAIPDKVKAVGSRIIRQLQS